VWAGVDNAWEQEKLEARKMLVNRAASHTSAARGVRTQGGSGKNYQMPHHARERETIAGKTPSPYRAIAGKSTPQNF